MKKMILRFSISLIFSSILFAQYPDNDLIFDKNIKSIIANTDRSHFKYIPKVKGHYTLEQWRAVIDSTWGEGLPTEQKLSIFELFWNTIDEQYPSFHNIQINWDSLRNFYRPEIAAGVSRGRFDAIMNWLKEHLSDLHTQIKDNIVVFDSLKPGIPLFVGTGYHSTLSKHFLDEEFCHFGASLAPMPDSSLFVYNVVQNHPLGLEIGDIVIGYDNIPWKDLLKEIRDAELPIWRGGTGASNKSSVDYDLLTSVGENWHLFDTIDIVKYDNGDTLHLPTSLLQNQEMELISTDQLPISGVPFPDTDNGHWVSSGIIDGTNIGYIYVWNWSQNGDFPTPTINTGDDFRQAVETLKNENNIEGLIVDSRYNAGGYAVEVSKALGVFFNEDQDIILNFVRSDPNNHLALQRDYSVDHYFHVTATRELFQRPIAMLTGPFSASGGDIMPLEMRYHPFVRTFGRPTNGAYGTVGLAPFNLPPDWRSIITLTNTAVFDHPDKYLTHKNILPDEEVWLERDDAVDGDDTVVEAAIAWIKGMIYAYDVKPNLSFVRPVIDTLNVTVNVKNPPNHNLAVVAIIDIVDSINVDSLTMFDDGIHGDSLAGDGLYGTYFDPISNEQTFKISVGVTDLDSNHYHILPNTGRFTTAGPVKLDSIAYTKGHNDYYVLKPYVRNMGKSTTITGAKVRLYCDDPWVASINSFYVNLPEISPGATVSSSSNIIVNYIDSLFSGYFNFRAEITVDGWTYWKDSLKILIVTEVEGKAVLPLTFKLEQNYPNPFNPSTTIKYTIPYQSKVILKIYDVLGSEIETLIKEEKPAGSYELNWNVTNLPSGVYFYRLKAGSFVQTKKMILMK